MATTDLLLPTLIGSIGIATIETVLIIWARRDFKNGIKKFILKKFGRRPLKVRLHGPDMTVKEYIIGTAGKGEHLKIENGIYFIRKAAIRKSDDDVNEINFSYKNILPINPDDPKDNSIYEEGLTDREEEILQKIRDKTPLTDEEKKMLAKLSAEGEPEKKPWIKIRLPFTKKKEEEELPELPEFEPSDFEEAPKGTNPNLLDKFVEYVYLAAKAEALKGLDIKKWLMVAALGAGAAAIIGWMTYTFVKGDLWSHVGAVKSTCTAAADACVAAAHGNATIITL